MNPLDNSEVITHELLPLISKCYQNKRFILRTQLGSQITNSNLTSPVKISQEKRQDFPSPKCSPLTSADSSHWSSAERCAGHGADAVLVLVNEKQAEWKGLPAPWPPGFHEMPHKAPSHHKAQNPKNLSPVIDCSIKKPLPPFHGYGSSFLI